MTTPIQTFQTWTCRNSVHGQGETTTETQQNLVPGFVCVLKLVQWLTSFHQYARQKHWLCNSRRLSHLNGENWYSFDPAARWSNYWPSQRSPSTELRFKRNLVGPAPREWNHILRQPNNNDFDVRRKDCSTRQERAQSLYTGFGCI